MREMDLIRSLLFLSRQKKISMSLKWSIMGCSISSAINLQERARSP